MGGVKYYLKLALFIALTFLIFSGVSLAFLLGVTGGR
jgi:TRAP-type mannitol/chloroaromatic compound transport system permease small subunit